MRIRKTSQTTTTSAQVVNTRSDSQKDAYCCDYVNKLNSYSTTEQVVGTWINSKPIYRKVIQKVLTKDYSEGSISSCFVRPIADSIDEVINLVVFVRVNNDKETIISTGNKGVYASFANVESQGRVYFEWDTANDSQYIGKNGCVIIEYTKTTD